jgi:CO/xanthine dehydrogenase FAD-binding subunit
MNPWRNYIIPDSVTGALQALTLAPGPAAAIAGGTDLLLDLEQGRHSPVDTLVDLNGVAEMRVIEPRRDQLFIGAAAPLSHIARHPLVMRHAQALVEACDLIGGPQVRNVATLGGNVAHALPAADGTIALLALGASAAIAGLDGNREVPISGLFLGPGKSALQTGSELLVGFYIPLAKSSQSSSFKRIMRPQGVALPILNVAIWLQRRDDVVEAIRIAVGPGAAVPWRALAAEQAVTGDSWSDETGRRALGELLAHIEFRSSPRRGSAEYRRNLVQGLFLETLGSAWERASKVR